MNVSKLTTKFQTTIPKEIREKLKLKAGDSVVFEILSDGTVTIRKITKYDKEYLKAIESTLSEWRSKFDEEDYEHLQNL